MSMLAVSGQDGHQTAIEMAAQPLSLPVRGVQTGAGPGQVHRDGVAACCPSPVDA